MGTYMGMIQAKTAFAPFVMNKPAIANLAFLASADIAFHAETSEVGHCLFIMAIWHGQHVEFMQPSLPFTPTL
jgi:hypothetical protein